MIRWIQFGDFVMKCSYPDEIKVPQNFLKFEVEEQTEDYEYEISLVDQLPELDGNLVFQREDIQVYEKEQRELRKIASIMGEEYAVYEEINERQAHIFVKRDWLSYMEYDTVFHSLFALEKRMLQKQSLILHTSYYQYQGDGILFSAASGVGKTTQSNLWIKYRGGKVVNGDRSLLRKMDGIWYACGWPVCGSSEICHVENTPIKAIVMLSQGPENVIRKLSPREAFSKVYGQITVNRWNMEQTNQAISAIENLVQEIPIYALSCTISEEAVETLEQALYGSK